MPEPGVKSIGDIAAVMRRRMASLILPALGVFFLAALIAFLWPPTYQSTATILIEEQEMPRDFVVSAVTSFAEQRIHSINQRIMSTTKLLEIINRFNLYAEERKKRTTEEIVEKMRRKHIRFETISAEILDRRTGQPTKATIAFTLSYKGRRPGLVQQVANTLASLYLEENLRARAQQAIGTSRFLEEEMKEVKAQLAKIDTRITPFKTKYIQVLPEHLQINLQALDRSERDLERLRSDLGRAREREGYLQTQIEYLKAQPPPATNSESDPDKILLKELKARLVQLQSKFSEKYPDVIKIKIEIAELEERVQEEPEDQEEENSRDNSALVTLASQLAGTQNEIESYKREIEDLSAKKQIYERRIEATPGVEETYKALMQERNNTQAKYDDLMKKFLEAKVSQGLEKEQMGERFTLIDPARFPEQPVSPNIPVILVIGLVLGGGAGIGTAYLREFSDHSVRSAGELAAATQFPVLAGIPVIVTRRERRRKRRNRWLLAGAVLSVLVAGLAVFHFFIMDLDVFWEKLMRRLIF